jgi:hypothetical protein
VPQFNDQSYFASFAEELRLAVGQTMPDIIAPHLKVLFCGINPSVYSVVVAIISRGQATVSGRTFRGRLDAAPLLALTKTSNCSTSAWELPTL